MKCSALAGSPCKRACNAADGAPHAVPPCLAPPLPNTDLQSSSSSLRISWLMSCGPSGRTRMPCGRSSVWQARAAESATVGRRRPASRVRLRNKQERSSPKGSPQLPTLVRETAMASWRTCPTSCLTRRWMNWCGAQNTRTLASLQGQRGGGRGGRGCARTCSAPRRPGLPCPDACGLLAAEQLAELVVAAPLPPPHRTVSMRSGHAVTLGPRETPGRYFTFSCVSLMMLVSFLQREGRGELVFSRPVAMRWPMEGRGGQLGSRRREAGRHSKRRQKR